MTLAVGVDDAQGCGVLELVGHFAGEAHRLRCGVGGGGDAVLAGGDAKGAVEPAGAFGFVAEHDHVGELAGEAFTQHAVAGGAELGQVEADRGVQGAPVVGHGRGGPGIEAVAQQDHFGDAQARGGAAQGEAVGAVGAAGEREAGGLPREANGAPGLRLSRTVQLRRSLEPSRTQAVGSSPALSAAEVSDVGGQCHGLAQVGLPDDAVTGLGCHPGSCGGAVKGAQDVAPVPSPSEWPVGEET